MLQFGLPVRVYFEDTDSGGVVHHTSYIKFFERGRIEAFRTTGIELNKLHSDYDAQFVVHSIEIQYLKPAFLDQLLYVSTEIVDVGFASISYNQKAYLEVPEGLLLCKANIRLACINRQFRPRRLPEVLSGGIKW